MLFYYDTIEDLFALYIVIVCINTTLIKPNRHVVESELCVNSFCVLGETSPGDLLVTSIIIVGPILLAVVLVGLVLILIKKHIISKCNILLLLINR